MIENSLLQNSQQKWSFPFCFLFLTDMWAYLSSPLLLGESKERIFNFLIKNHKPLTTGMGGEF